MAEVAMVNKAKAKKPKLNEKKKKFTNEVNNQDKTRIVEPQKNLEENKSSEKHSQRKGKLAQPRARRNISMSFIEDDNHFTMNIAELDASFLGDIDEDEEEKVPGQENNSARPSELDDGSQIDSDIKKMNQAVRVNPVNLKVLIQKMTKKKMMRMKRHQKLLSRKCAGLWTRMKERK